MPIVSVIVPVYKTEKYLSKCIDSLLAQTLQDLEIILVDDGSPDNSGKICDDYADQHPNISVIHKENEGLTQARVSGMRIASGKYIAFVDSDDWILPDMYAPMVQQAEAHLADIVAVGFTRDFGSRTEKFCNQFPSGVYQGEALKQLQTQALFDPDTMQQPFAPCVWAKLYRSESLLPVLLSRTDTIGFGEDSLFTFPALFQSQCVVILNEHWQYQYQIREGSITNSYYRNYMSDLYTVYDKLTEAAAPIKTPQLTASIAYDYIFLYQGGIGQELSRRNPKNLLEKYRSLRTIAQDKRLGQCISCVDLNRYPRRTAAGLRLLSEGRHNRYILLWLFGKFWDKSTAFLTKLRPNR